MISARAKMNLIIDAAFAVAVLSGCCTDLSLRPTITTNSGQTLCARHHVPLVTVSGFEFRQPWPIIDPTPQFDRVLRCYPNSISTTQGESIPEALDNLREATELYLDEFPLERTGQPFVTTFEVAARA
jgi:hypothetical protein